MGLAKRSFALGVLLANAGIWAGLPAAAGVQKSRPPQPKQYQVEVQVQPAPGVGKGMVFAWIEILRGAGAAGVREARGHATTDPKHDRESPAIREKSYAHILVSAVIDRTGRLHIGQRVFRMQDRARLRALVARIQQKGVPVPDPAAPMWGLSQAQIKQLLAVLKTPSKFEPEDVTRAGVLAQLRVRTGLHVELTPEARNATGSARGTQRTGRLSLGAATAYLLDPHRLAFEPRIDSSGKVFLLVLTQRESKKPWPIGRKPERSPGRVAPQLFRFTEFQTTGTPLEEVIDAFAQVLDMDLLLDHNGLAERQIDPARLRSTAYVARTSWNEAIGKTLAPLGLRHELRIDDASRPFLWITARRKKSATRRDHPH